MEVKKIHLRRKIIVPMAVFLVLMAILVAYTEHWIEFDKLHDMHRADIKKTQQLLAEELDSEAAVFSELADSVCHDSVIRQAFIAGDRDALLEQAHPLYRKFNDTHNVTHFYFHQLDRRCFLRVHQPDRFGDVIDRYTLTGTIERDEPFYGIELGPMGTFTLRSVYPWRVNGQLIGFVEIGKEIDHIVASLHDVMDVDMILMVNKTCVSRSDWETGVAMLGHPWNWDQLKSVVIAASTISDFSPELLGYIQNCECDSGECGVNKACESVVTMTFDQSQQMAGCFPLVDAGGSAVGRMFISQRIDGYAAMIKSSSLFFAAMLLIGGFVVWVFFFITIGRLQKDLIAYDRAQKVEIVHRRFAEAQFAEAKKRSEAAYAELRQTQTKLKLHVEHMPLGVIQWDRDLRVESWNPAAETIFGFTAEEAMGCLATDLIVPEDIKNRTEKIRQHLITQEGGTHERHENLTRDGRRIMCQWYNTPLVDNNGKVIGISSIVEDITIKLEYEKRLKDAKKEAEASNRAKSQFMANMSHELRTPMNSILGFSDLLCGEPLTDEQLDFAQTIYSNGQHLLSLINDVLDLSKIEAGKEQLVVETCSLRSLVRQLDALLRISAESKGLQFTVSLSPDVPESILADTKHLYQCLINLVGNAIKFTEEGSVTVRIEQQDDQWLYFQVQDTGVGIPADRHEKIFETFEQADSSTSRKYGGSGLGLAITRQLVTMMDGALTVDSAEGEGATFTIRLPLNCPVTQQTHPGFGAVLS